MAPAVTREILITYGALGVSSVGNGNGQYTFSTTPPAWVVTGGSITFFGFGSAANNGTFTISGVVGNVVTVNNASSTSAGAMGFSGMGVAGPTNFSHHDKYKFQSNYKTRTYTFDVVFAGATSYSDFLIYCNQIEAAFRTPRQRFRVSFSGTVFDDLDPTAAAGGNTGFNQEAEIEKLGEDFDTSRSRGWRVRVTAQLPADLAGQSGRQDSSVRVDYEPSRRRTITISGRYTALGANNATAQYLASIDTYEAAVRVAVANGDGSVYERVAEDFTHDDADKNCDFTVRSEELIYDQSSGTRDNTSIKQGRYSYTRQQIAPGDSDPSTMRLEIIDVEFECWIDKTVTVDLEGFWTSTLKTYLITQAQSKFALGAIGLTDHTHKCDFSLNRIFGKMTIQAASTNGGGLVQSRYTTKVMTNPGKILIPTWDGNALSYHVFDGKAKIIRTRTWTKLLLGGASGGGGGAGGSNGATVGLAGLSPGSGSIAINFMNGFSVGAIGGPYNGATQTALVQAALSDGPPPGGDGAAPALLEQSGWVPLSDTVTTTPITIGLPGYQISLSEVERELIEQYVEAPAGGGGGGGGPGAGSVAT